MKSLIDGILLGLGVCVPFGPINILIVNKAMSSFKNAFMVGLGASSADVMYLVLIRFGLLGFDKVYLDILSMFGCVFLLYMAFLTFKSSTNIKISKDTKTQKPFSNFIKGFFLNITNPYVITFWLSIATVVNNSISPMFMLFGLIGTVVMWVFCLSFFVYKYVHFFNNKILKSINVISSLVLVYFAFMLIYNRFF